MDELALQLAFAYYIEEDLVSEFKFTKKLIKFKCDMIIHDLYITIEEESGKDLSTLEEQKLKFTSLISEGDSENGELSIEDNQTVENKEGPLIDNVKFFLEEMYNTYIENIKFYADGETPLPTPLSTEDDIFEIESFHYHSSNPAFINDFNEAQALLGSNELKIIPDLNNIRIRVVVSDLSINMKNIFKVDENLPLWLSITFGPSYLEQDGIPKIVYKQPDGDRQAIGIQATTILKSYFKFCWKTTNTIKDHPKYSKFVKNKEKFNNKNHPLPQLAMQLIKNDMDISQTVQSLKKNAINSKYDYRVDHRNFIIEMIVFLYMALKDIQLYCVNCGMVIECKSSSNRPFICTSPICQYQYIEKISGIQISCSIEPVNVYSDLQHNADIADLLISMAYAAAKSPRKDLIFHPSPKIRSSNFAADIQKMMSVEKMIGTGSDKNLKKSLGEDIYNTLDWILRKNRPLMVKIPKNEQITQLKSNDQYLLQQDNAEKHLEFEKLRETHGSFFAFHGSSIENFHSILRRGLVVASGTKLMTTGAAYGHGIYMATDVSTSFSYAKMGTAWSKSKLGANTIQCMAICEVIKHPSINTVPNPYYVIDNEKYVTTRFFVFYRESRSFSLNIKTIERKLRTFYK